MRGLLVWTGLFFSVLFPLRGQEDIGALTTTLEREYHSTIHWNASTERVEFIHFPTHSPLVLAGETLVDKAYSFLEGYGDVLGLTHSSDLVLLSSEDDLAGQTHLRFQQRYQGISVFASDLRFHFSAEKTLKAVSGILIPDLEIDPQAYVPLPTILAFAKATILKNHPNVPLASLTFPQAELQVFREGLVEGRTGENHLAFALEITNQKDVREYLFFDAHTGRLLSRYSGICSLISRRLYETDTSNQIWEESDGSYAGLTTAQQAIIEVSGQTYNFFKHVFGRSSYDNADAEMKGINNASFLDCPNANWNGISVNFCNGTTVDDIIGHEWAHAYTEYTNNLIYSWQAGAINEAYSDIWGETLDLVNNYGLDIGHNSLRGGCNDGLRWLMAEESMSFGSALRDLWDPTCKNDPGKMSDNQYQCASGDNGGVHTNSGVINHAYALLVDGGSFNGQTVAGIGLTKAAHIFWQTQLHYLTRTSDFDFLANALEAAAADLIGIDLPTLTVADLPAGPSGEIITTADLEALSSAITAVEMRQPSSCSYSSMLAPNPPILCATQGNNYTLFFQEDFENGWNTWTATEIPVNPASWTPRNWTLSSNLPNNHPGQGLFGPNPYVGDCDTNLDNGILRLESPQITIPAYVDGAIYLTFDHYVSLENRWDGGNLKYQKNEGNWATIPGGVFEFNSYNRTLMNAPMNDNPLQGQSSFSGADGGSVAGSWGTSQINLTTLGITPNETIRFRWELGTDGCNGWDGWYLDDIEMGYCAQTILPVAWETFTLRALQDRMQLNWTIIAASDNAGFRIERSVDDLPFQVIGWVDGQGDSDERQSYTYADKEVETGHWYHYRLQQVDWDGDFSYSSIQSGQLDSDTDATTWSSYPNPVREQLHLQKSDPVLSSTWSVQILHPDGRILPFADGRMRQSTNEPNHSFFVNHLSPGLYFIQLQSASQRQILPFVRQ